MPGPLLATKPFAPPLRAQWVQRPRLVQRMEEGLRQGHRLTLISAPAGFGKTTLVTEWLGGARWMGLDTNQLPGGAFVALTEVIGLALMIRIMNRHKPVRSGRGSLITVALLLLLPICVALAMRKLSVVIVSTVVWQFVFSGFGEEFVWRGYVQWRLNQAFGRPMRLFGIQFGPGLIIAAGLFGLLHAFNTYDAAIGLSSLSWGWALWTFTASLTFGTMREKTGTLLAPGIAHGLPDAVGEALMKMFGWAVPS